MRLLEPIKENSLDTLRTEFAHPKRKSLRLQLMVVEAQEHGPPADRMLPELRPEEKIQFWVGVYELAQKGKSFSHGTKYFLPDKPETLARHWEEFVRGWSPFLRRATRA